VAKFCRKSAALQQAQRINHSIPGISQKPFKFHTGKAGYREQTLMLYQASEMLGLSRVETEDFLDRHHIPLAVIDEADLDREAAPFEAASRRNSR
jgi:hypothetical protein